MIANGHDEDHPTEKEIDETLEESFPASDPPGWTLGIEQPDTGHTAERAVEPISESSRHRLQELRHLLLRLHKLLMDAERAAWERTHGRVSGGQLLKLLINHKNFAWLRVISELIVRIDETIEADDLATAEDARSLLTQARKFLTPSELGDAFAQKYQAALQRDPDVIMAHKDLRIVVRADN